MFPEQTAGYKISIHALREEGDEKQLYKRKNSPEISIHALREEGDMAVSSRWSVHRDFYPRPPRGGRPMDFTRPSRIFGFLSTPSARRATWRV